MGSAARVENYDGVVGNCYIPGPSCTNAELLQLLKSENQLIADKGQHHIWVQVTGRETWNLSDDLYRRELQDVATDVKLPPKQKMRSYSPTALRQTPVQASAAPARKDIAQPPGPVSVTNGK